MVIDMYSKPENEVVCCVGEVARSAGDATLGPGLVPSLISEPVPFRNAIRRSNRVWR